MVMLPLINFAIILQIVSLQSSMAHLQSSRVDKQAVLCLGNKTWNHDSDIQVSRSGSTVKNKGTVGKGRRHSIDFHQLGDC